MVILMKYSEEYIIMVVQRRKNWYGNNLSDVAKVWGRYFLPVGNGIFTPEDASEMLSLMWETYSDATQIKIFELSDLHDMCDNQDEQCEIQADIESLRVVLDDSLLDKACYTWITDNYEKYIEL
jgi:hypothetical protein